MAGPADYGFRVVPGTRGDRYYPPEGYTGKRLTDGTVARRQVRNAMAREHGYTSLAQYESRRAKYANDDRFQNFMRMWFEREHPNLALDREGNPLRDRRQTIYPGMRSGILEAYEAVPKGLWSQRKSREYRDPNGPVARFLVALGYRDESWQYQVGDSPTASA